MTSKNYSTRATSATSTLTTAVLATLAACLGCLSKAVRLKVPSESLWSWLVSEWYCFSRTNLQQALSGFNYISPFNAAFAFTNETELQRIPMRPYFIIEHILDAIEWERHRLIGPDPNQTITQRSAVGAIIPSHTVPQPPSFFFSAEFPDSVHQNGERRMEQLSRLLENGPLADEIITLHYVAPADFDSSDEDEAPTTEGNTPETMALDMI
ncbi:hypothetical protein CDV36_009784 [Fusarium kuroshium]|uniref:Uncharacterized protein n=1 Tax=Fusarium kuroshium TaxID=2010991 RepID=A0A3M2RZ59_9HYPO|nr:hypothetical protein CDV36_009784 [Fusarium kuroshium]